MNTKLSARFWYIVIGLGVVLVIVSASLWFPEEAVKRGFLWAKFVAATAVTYAFPLMWHRKHFRIPRFWFVFFTFLLVHISVFAAAILHKEQIPGIVFGLATPLEWLAMLPLLDWASNATSPLTRKA